MSIIRTKVFCPICSKKLIRTSDQYRVCPDGHGRLYPVPQYVKDAEVQGQGRRQLDQPSKHVA